VPLDPLKSIWEARIFEEWGLAEGEAKIISYLRKKGFLFASVRSSIKKVDNEIQVIYVVTPGDKYTILDVSFEGLKYFTSSQVRKELEIKERIPFLSEIDGARLFELPREIEVLYKSHGFSETSVDLNFGGEGQKIRAIFFIAEGRQEKIGKISFEGANLFNNETLLKQIGSFLRGPFYQPNIQRDIEKLEDYYLNQGVRGTEIRARIEKSAENLFSVIFEINEGSKVKIEKIVITGNDVTKKSTIQREFQVKRGDYAYYKAIRETKRRLERLAIFNEVRVEEILLSPEKENLVISVKEGKRNFASVGLGLETKNEPQTFAVWDNVIRPRGTAEFIRSNIFGYGAQLSVVGQASIKEKRAVFSLEQPYLFSLAMPTYLNVWIEREGRKSFSFDRRGISLTTIKSVTEYITLLATLRYSRTTLFDLLISESELDRQYSPFSTSSVSGSLILDRRDDPFNPRKGSFASFVLEWAYPLFGAESDFFKTFIKLQHFIPILNRLNFSLTSRLGLGRGLMPINERFFAGGSNSFRGAKFDELGPSDPISLKPIGGKALFLLNLEFVFPLFVTFENLSGAIFYDMGNVFSKRKQFNFIDMRDAIGLGLRYRTPLGPVRLEVGWSTDAPKGEKKVSAFITIGNVF
jgi:outer membrane protein insertion porin family